MGTRIGERAAVVPERGRAARLREREENFPVALAALPRRLRGDLHAVYAFARAVDEIGDSWDGDRRERLRQVSADLGVLWSGRTPAEPFVAGLAPVVAAHRLEEEPFQRLVRANQQDQVVQRYRTYDELLGYCRLSAEPVGRIVLGVFECPDPVTAALSDRVCSALQLLEHWQDVAEDRRMGRVYLPAEDLACYGVAEHDLDAVHASERLRALMRFEIDRAAARLASGAMIVHRLDGWARLCVAGFVAGGRATAAALQHSGGEVLASTPRPSRAGTLVRLAGLLLGRQEAGDA